MARWVASLAVCSATLLVHGQTPRQVMAFTFPAGVCRGRGQNRRSFPGSVLSASSASDGRSRRSGADKTVVAGPGRAREIAAQARRRARDERSRIRDARRPPSSLQGTVEGPPSLQETAGTRSAVLPHQPPKESNSRESGVAASVAVEAREQRQAPNLPPPPPRPSNSEEEVDALQRRVKEILDEYCTKAPPEEQWPPGRRIRVRGVEIYYKDTGSRTRGGKRSTSRDRPTFVLLHGLAGSTASWDEVVGDLSEYGRVISFDRPGFGKTERVMPPAGLPSWRLCAKTMGENPYSADFAAKALFGVIDRLGVEKVIVVAHSLGAQVALRAARARPSMVRAMVLVAPAVLNPLDSKFVMGRDPDSNVFSAILNLRTRVEITAKLAAFNLQLLQPGEAPLHAVRNMTLNGDLEARVQNNFHDRSITNVRPELVSKYIEPLRDPLWDRGLVHFYKSLQGEIQPGEQLLQNTLDVWKGPCMIITGDDDPTVPTQSSIYVAEVMEGRLVVVESCAHIPMDEKPEVFVSSVLSFTNSGEVEDAWRSDGKSAKFWW